MGVDGRLDVLLLGGSGIIGRELSQCLASDLHRVWSISRGSRRPYEAEFDRVTNVIADVRNPGSLDAALRGIKVDVVVDLLSYTVPQLEATLSVLEGRFRQYLFASSATVYASCRPGERLVESSALGSDHWEYPAKKIQCEERVRTLAAGHGFGYTIVRPYITYSSQRVAFGAWEALPVLDRLRRGEPVVIGDEVASATTALTHSSDLARGLGALLGNDKAVNETFHVASDESLSWGEVFGVAAEAVAQPLTVLESPVEKVLTVFPEMKGKFSDRMMHRGFDLSKFRSACPDFDFRMPIRDGYRDAIDGFLRSPRASKRYNLEGRMDRLVNSVSPERVSRARYRGVNAATVEPLSGVLRYLAGYDSRLERLAALSSREMRRFRR